MSTRKPIDNNLNQINDNSYLQKSNELEIKEGITPNNKLQTIYTNLVGGIDIKLPEIYGIKNLLILLDYFYNKFNEIKDPPSFILSRKVEIYYLVIEKVLKMNIELNDNGTFKTLELYFLDEDFFTAFLIKLTKLNDSLFFEKFSFFSKVSILF